VPHPGSSWRPHGQPATQPHEYVRGGTTKILTLFHPATGQVYRKRCSVTLGCDDFQGGCLGAQCHGISSSMRFCGQPFTKRVSRSVK